MQKTRAYVLLAGAGALPFVACALMPHAGLATIDPFGSFDRIAAAYGLAIVSFLAGVHWGTCIYRGDKAPRGLMIASNAITVAVWIAFLITSPAIALGVMILAFLGLLLIDLRLLKSGLITGHYYRTRAVVTTVVVASLLAIIAAAT